MDSSVDRKLDDSWEAALYDAVDVISKDISPIIQRVGGNRGENVADVWEEAQFDIHDEIEWKKLIDEFLNQYGDEDMFDMFTQLKQATLNNAMPTITSKITKETMASTAITATSTKTIQTTATTTTPSKLFTDWREAIDDDCLSQAVRHAEELAKEYSTAIIVDDFIKCEDPPRRCSPCNEFGNRVSVECQASVTTDICRKKYHVGVTYGGMYVPKENRPNKSLAWAKLVEAIGSTDQEWPVFIKDAFKNSNFNNHRRMLVTHFTVLNNASWEVVDGALMSQLGDHYFVNERRRQIYSRYHSFHTTDRVCSIPNKTRAYSYHIRTKKVMYLDGKPF